MARRSPTFTRVLMCERCGTEVREASPTQRYCRTCSDERGRERQRKWKEQSGFREDPEKRRQREERNRSENIERGRKLNADSTFGFAEQPDITWLVQVRVPFSYAASKNHIYGIGGNPSHVYKRAESTAIRDEIALLLRSALHQSGRTIHQGKLWLDIFVQKPNNKGDAVNVIDLVSDAVQDATGLDDRWYSIRSLDWEICKDEPRLFVGISQTITEDHKACSYCGQVLPADHFSKNRRECRECRSRRPLAS